MSACNLVHHHIDDGLGEARRIARHLFDGGRHGLDQLGLGASALPGVVGFQSHAGLDVREGEALGPLVVASQLGHDVGGLVELFEHMAQVVGHLFRLVDGDARRQLHLYPDRAFVERGQEVLADGDGEGDGAAQDEQQRRQYGAAFADEYAHMVGIVVVEFCQPLVVVELAGFAVGKE